MPFGSRARDAEARSAACSGRGPHLVSAGLKAQLCDPYLKMWEFQTRRPRVMTTVQGAIAWAQLTHFPSLHNCLHLQGPSACLTLSVHLTPELL